MDAEFPDKFEEADDLFNYLFVQECFIVSHRMIPFMYLLCITVQQLKKIKPFPIKL